VETSRRLRERVTQLANFDYRQRGQQSYGGWLRRLLLLRNHRRHTDERQRPSRRQKKTSTLSTMCVRLYGRGKRQPQKSPQVCPVFGSCQMNRVTKPTPRRKSAFEKRANNTGGGDITQWKEERHPTLGKGRGTSVFCASAYERMPINLEAARRRKEGDQYAGIPELSDTEGGRGRPAAGAGGHTDKGDLTTRWRRKGSGLKAGLNKKKNLSQMRGRSGGLAWVRENQAYRWPSLRETSVDRARRKGSGRCSRERGKEKPGQSGQVAVQLVRARRLNQIGLMRAKYFQK